MQKRTSELKPVEKKDCVHHFLIPTPEKEVMEDVIGICKKCGLTQEHKNYLPWQATYWKRTTNNDRKPGQGHGLTKTQLEQKLGGKIEDILTPGFL